MENVYCKYVHQIQLESFKTINTRITISYYRRTKLTMGTFNSQHFFFFFAKVAGLVFFKIDLKR